MTRRTLFILMPLVLGAGADPAAAQGDFAAERAAVERAVLDYVDALYEVEPSRVEVSVHPELMKLGFSRRAGESAYRRVPMTYQQLHALAARWNAGGRVDPATARREVVVLDVLDQTASAKLIAEWGIDYMHLGKFDGRWQIIHVLWQSHPPSPAR